MREYDPMHGLDTSRPNIARVYDYWLGGRDNFAADRKLAERLAKWYPPWVQACRDNRAFVERAVTWAATRGIGQFLDLGAGLPTSPYVHEVARAVVPGSRVAYVDDDRVVVSHIRALFAHWDDGIAAVQADLAAPAVVLANPELRAVIDPGQPVCVLLGLVLHFIDADAAREVVAGYGRLAPPGSVIAVSTLCCADEELFGRTRKAYTPAELYNHSREQTAGFLGGLEVIPPGVVVGRAWRGGMPDPGLRPGGPVYVLAGAAKRT